MLGVHASPVQALCSLLVCLACCASWGVPADGSLEGDVTPELASPPWTGPNNEQPSLTEWVTATNGCLVQKTDAPAGAWMRLVPSPLTGLSYTIETRFRITKCGTKERYSYPLVFLVCTEGLGQTQVTVGRQFKKGSVSVHSVGKDVRILDEQVDQDKWLTLRLVVEGGLNSVRTRTFLNGEKVLDVPDGSFREYNWCHIRSDGGDDAWELDYFRWKNAAVDISVPLDEPLTSEEKMAELFE